MTCYAATKFNILKTPNNCVINKYSYDFSTNTRRRILDAVPLFEECDKEVLETLKQGYNMELVVTEVKPNISMDFGDAIWVIEKSLETRDFNFLYITINEFPQS
jgi:hypothetical protein